MKKIIFISGILFLLAGFSPLVWGVETTIKGGKMSITDKGETILFKEGVRLHRGGDTLKAKEMKTDKNREKIFAYGNVNFFRRINSSDTLNGFGKKGFYDSKKGKGFLEGGLKRAHVIFKRKMSSTSTIRMDLYAKRINFQRDKSHVVAQGRVYGKSLDPDTGELYEFWSDQADYYGEEKKIVLSGKKKPRVHQTLDKNFKKITGKTIIYYIEDERVEALDEAKAIINDYGKEKTMSLKAVDLEKNYGKRKVVDGISVEVSPGEIVGLSGPNGAGKTTTFYMIVGLIQSNRGQVLMNGKDITNLAMFRRARAGLGYLSQEPSIFRQMSVEDNLRAILEHRKGDVSEKERRIDSLLDEFGLTRLRKQKASTLSGGEKRRCEIARALTTDPQILLLDEPFVGIDPITVADIQGILQVLKKKGLGILISDHNVQATLEIVDRANIVYEGKILTSGPSEKLLTDPEARRVYLGEKFKI